MKRHMKNELKAKRKLANTKFQLFRRAMVLLFGQSDTDKKLHQLVGTVPQRSHKPTPMIACVDNATSKIYFNETCSIILRAIKEIITSSSKTVIIIDIDRKLHRIL